MHKVDVDIWDRDRKKLAGTTQGAPSNIARGFYRRRTGRDGTGRPFQADDAATNVGDNASAQAGRSTALGPRAESMDERNTSIGAESLARVQHSTVVGEQAIAHNYGSTVIGRKSVVRARNGIVLGRGSGVSHSDSIVIGNELFSEADGEIKLGPHLKVDSSGNVYNDALNISGYLAAITSGIYTPVRSAETNLDSNVTMTGAQFSRNGNVVTVSGRFTANPTATGATSFEMTVPGGATLLAANDLAGVAFCGSIAGQGAEIIGVVANGTAKVQWIAVDVSSQTWSYIFLYQIT